MPEKDSGGEGGSRYTVHVKKIKNSVIGDGADQRNLHPTRAKGITVLVAVAVVAALTALAVLAVVLLGGSGSSVGSAPPVPSGLPGPPTASPTTPSPAPSHPTSRPPSATPGPLPDASSPAPDLPPPPRPTVRAPRPPASSAPPATPAAQPSPTPCPLRKEYRVTVKAQLWNAEGEHTGDVASGTLFFRQETASYPEPVDDRYYGTVDQAISGSAIGYVLRKKLDYVGTVEFCRGAAN